MDDKTTNIIDIKTRILNFIEERDWTKYHNPKDIAISISIEASELLELFQWTKEQDVKEITSNPQKRQKIADELADIIIYCLSLSNAIDIDVSQAISEKIDKNSAKYPVDKIKGDYKKYTEISDG